MSHWYENREEDFQKYFHPFFKVEISFRLTNGTTACAHTAHTYIYSNQIRGLCVCVCAYYVYRVSLRCWECFAGETRREEVKGWGSGDLSVLCAHHHHHQVYGEMVFKRCSRMRLHLHPGQATAAKSWNPRKRKHNIYKYRATASNGLWGWMTLLEDISVTIADISHAARWTLLFPPPS